MELIHEPSVGVIGTKGDSQCYMGVQRKVETIHEHLRQRLGRSEGQMPMRLVQPAGILEHNRPAIIMSDGPIRPGVDSVTEEPIDIVTGFQVAGHPDDEYKKRIACEACPGYGSCGCTTV